MHTLPNVLLGSLLLSLALLRGQAVELAAGDIWKHEFQNPIWVPVKFSGTFNCIGTYGVNLGGSQARGTNYNAICGGGWDETYELEANLVLYKTYTVLAWSSNLYGCEINLKAPTVNDLLDGKGKNSHQYNRYRIYVKYGATNQFERLMEPLRWNTESDGSGDCGFRNLIWEIQVRPAKGARPVTRRRDRKAFADDQADESWSKDEDPISGAAAPGDGSLLRLGAGKADDPAGARIQWEVLLGRLWNGDSAGKLRYLQTRLGPNSFTPLAVDYTPRSYNSNELEVVTLTNYHNQLRQIKAPQSFVDVVSNSITSFELRFYTPTAVGAKDGAGFYTLDGGTLPFVVWRFSSPDGSTNQLRLSELRHGKTNLSQLVYNPAGYVWTLTHGAGAEARIESRTILTNSVGADRFRTETLEIKNGAGVISDRALEVYRKYDWGYEIVQVTTDPGAANLLTTLGYFSDTNEPYRYKRLEQVVYPDGYWERREYSDLIWDPVHPYGALLRIIHPWKDTPLTTDNDDCQVTEFDYTDLQYGSFQVEKWHDRSAFEDNEIGATTFEEETFLGEEWDTEYEQRQFGDLEHYGEVIETRTYLDVAGALEGQVAYRLDKSGWLDSYDYEFGAYNPADLTFTASDTGSDLRKTIYHGSVTDGGGYDLLTTGADYDIEDVYLKTNKNTKEVFILRSGALVCKEQHVYLGGLTNFALIDRVLYQRDSLGHATNIIRIDPVTLQSRVIYKADWKGANTVDGDLKFAETDESGIQRTFAYDSLKRLTAITKKRAALAGYPSQSDIVTASYYDAASRLLTNVVSAGGLALTNITLYDRAGRKTVEVGPDGLRTTYSYANGGRDMTETFSSGATRITRHYLDRRPASITGTAEVNWFFDYSLSGQAIIDALYPKNVTTTRLGTSNSLRWTQSLTDHRPKPVQERRPAFQSTNDLVKTVNFFISGLPGSLTESGIENEDGTPGERLYTLIEYNWEGEKTAEGMDYDFNQTLETNTTDRVTAFETYYETNVAGHWFKVSRELGYLTDHSGTPTQLRATKQRLTGFTATEVSELLSFDANTNQTSVKVTVDLPAAKLTTVAAVPESTLKATSVTFNGLLQTESTPSVSAVAWHYYDALGRQTSMKDSLGFTTATGYDPNTGQIVARTDRFGQMTTYSYYPPGGPNAGLLYCETGPGGKKSYYQYNDRGQLTRKWGNVPYPEQRLYSMFGEMTNLITYRTGTQWTGTNWPANPPPGDVTKWLYDEPTGLLTNKTDAAGNPVLYSYYNNHLLKSKTRARSPTVRVTTHYNRIGELALWDYSDGTPGVTFTNYNRLGLPRQIIDGTGTHTLGYDHLGRLTSDSANGITLNNHFHRAYGRDYLELQIVGQSPVRQDYLYDTYGRLSSAAYNGYSAEYGHLPNSDLVQTTTSREGAAIRLTATRTWEGGSRLQSIQNSTTHVISGHAYAYDARNRRKRAALEDNSAWVYEYNDRDELVSARRYWSDWSPVSGQQFEYGFDHIGNRTSAGSGGDANGANLRATLYGVNGLNQYTSITTPGYEDIHGVAWATAQVTVNGNPTDRKGEYYHCELPLANGSAPVWQSLSVASAGTTINGNLLFPPLNQAPVYDQDGNLTRDGLWAYAWDAENRLIRLESVPAVPDNAKRRLEFAYDFIGRRTGSKISIYTNGLWQVIANTRLVCDGWNLVAELNATNRAPVRSYLWGKDLSGTMEGAGGIGGLLAVRDHGAGLHHFVAYDGNGNVTALVNAADQSVSARYEYSPFGETLRATGPMARLNPFRFSTKFTDHESGLVYYGYRYYHPSLGRWINRDPIEEQGGINIYAFVQNNPLNAIDALGREGDGISTTAAVGTSVTLAGFISSTIFGAVSAGLADFIYQLITKRGSVDFNEVLASLAIGGLLGAASGLTYGATAVAYFPELASTIGQQAIGGFASGLGFGTFAGSITGVLADIFVEYYSSPDTK